MTRAFNSTIQLSGNHGCEQWFLFFFFLSRVVCALSFCLFFFLRVVVVATARTRVYIMFCIPLSFNSRVFFSFFLFFFSFLPTASDDAVTSRGGCVLSFIYVSPCTLLLLG